MSEEKEHNGWIPFYERGCVGIKDKDGNILISSDFGYTEIGELRDDAAIAKKGCKSYLIDSTGNPLSSAYDLIAYIGEGHYKGGIQVGENDTVVLECADTRFVYEILDSKGKVTCDHRICSFFLPQIGEC